METVDICKKVFKLEGKIVIAGGVILEIMGKHLLKSIIGALLTIAIIFSCIHVGTVQAEASSKKAYYVSQLTGKKSNRYASVKSVTIRGNKLIVKGSFKKASSANRFNEGKTKFVKYGKKTFKLAGSCKFYTTGGVRSPQRVSKKAFLKLAHLYNGLGLSIAINSRGKVYRVTISS